MSVHLLLRIIVFLLGPEKIMQFVAYEQAFLDPCKVYHEVFLTEVVSLNCFYVNRADLFKL